MVAMGVGDQTMRHPLAFNRREQGIEMRIIIGTGVNDGDVALADNVGTAARVSERAGIVGDHPPQAGREHIGHAVREVDVFNEGNCGQNARLFRQRAVNHGGECVSEAAHGG